MIIKSSYPIPVILVFAQNRESFIRGENKNKILQKI